jgi:hypothetical protein
MGGSVDASSHTNIKGTALYLAPEAYDMQYSSASDVYAYGLTLNELLTECIPVPTSLAHVTGTPGAMQVIKAVCIDGDRPEICAEPGVVGEVIRRLIRQCWHQDPQQRCSFAHITSELPNITQAAKNIAIMGTMRIDPLALMKTLRLYGSSAPGFPSPAHTPKAAGATPSADAPADATAVVEAGTTGMVADVASEVAVSDVTHLTHPMNPTCKSGLEHTCDVKVVGPVDHVADEVSAGIKSVAIADAAPLSSKVDDADGTVNTGPDAGDSGSDAGDSDSGSDVMTSAGSMACASTPGPATRPVERFRRYRSLQY